MAFITISVTGLEEAKKALDSRKILQAVSLAINDTARQVRTEAADAIREKFNLPAARVKKEVRNIKFSTRSDLKAVIMAQGRPIGLTNFGAAWVRNVDGKARTTTAKKSTVAKRKSGKEGVRVQILRGKTTWLPGAFIGAARRGKTDGAGALHVFQRIEKNNSNSPLVNRATITIASMMAQEQVMRRMIKKAEAVLERRFQHHIDRLLT